MPWENAQKCADIVGVVGYNYAEKYYGPHHEEHPDWIIYGSETASVVQRYGDVQEGLILHLSIGVDRLQATSYGTHLSVLRRMSKSLLVMFSGKLMAVMAATLHPGPIRIEVSSKGFDIEVAQFVSLPANPTPSGVPAHMCSRDLPCISGRNDEIPLRKIELHSDSGQVFDACRKEMRIHASLHPSNTSYQEVEWSVVTDKGIPSGLSFVQTTAWRDLICFVTQQKVHIKGFWFER